MGHLLYAVLLVAVEEGGDDLAGGRDQRLEIVRVVLAYQLCAFRPGSLRDVPGGVGEDVEGIGVGGELHGAR